MLDNRFIIASVGVALDCNVYHTTRLLPIMLPLQHLTMVPTLITIFYNPNSTTTLVPLAEAVSMEAVLELPGHLSQKYLSNKLEDHPFRLLFQSLSLPNRARLLSASSPHASAWLQVVPAPGLNLHLDPSEFQAGIKWWLGIDSSQSANCPYCPSHCLDPLGHHENTEMMWSPATTGYETYSWSPAGELALVSVLKQEVVLDMTNIVHDLLTCLSRTGC